MTDTLSAALVSALLAGFFGSAHCFGMCGGISGLYAVKLEVVSLRRKLGLGLAYNGGRILGYALLGFLVAGVGKTIAALIPGLAGPVRIASGLIIILVGVQLAVDLKPLAALERGGALLWQRIAPGARTLLPVTNAGQAAALGVLWGFLPCGLVYSALMIAATSGDALAGSAVMLAFGLGTLPAMVLTGVGAAQLQAFMAKRWARRGAGLIVIALGLVTLWMPLAALFAGGGGGHQHH